MIERRPGGGTFSCSSVISIVCCIAAAFTPAAACGAQTVGTADACGNGAPDPGEQCDGTSLAGGTCQDVGFESGELACGSDCTFDLSGCFTCGNGVPEGPEECDGSDLGGQSCESLSYYGGTLSCLPDCRYDLVECAAAGRCGDGVVQLAEACDDGNSTDWDGCTACEITEFRVNHFSAHTQRTPALVMTGDDRFIVAYVEPYFDPQNEQASQDLILGCFHSATGDIIAAHEIWAPMSMEYDHPAVSADAGGVVFLVWEAAQGPSP